MAAREPIRPPELSELEAFALAVEEGSIAAAASRLRISGPAAAKRIRQLEVLANAPLLIRGRRGVTATEIGARLYPIAREALAQRGRIVGALTGAPADDPLRIAGMHRLLGRAPSAPAEELFKDAEALLAAIFHATGEAMILTRAEDGLIYEVNDAAAQLLGLVQEQLRGQTVFEVDLWEDKRRRDEYVQRAVATRTPQEGELVVHGHGSNPRLVCARFEALELRDQVHILVTIRCLSERGARQRRGPVRAGANGRLGEQSPARFLEALRRGEPASAEAVADDALDRGLDVAAIYAQLIEPAMTSIGDLWESDQISVAEEHLATEISHQVALRAFTRSHREPARSRQRVMMAAVKGEQHVLGLRLAADVLEVAGYDVLYFGADVPPDALLDACRIHQPEILGLTATMSLHVPALIAQIQALEQLERSPRVMIGGAASMHALTHGLDAPFVEHCDHIVGIVEQILATPPSANGHAEH
ncbi:MAG: cobalamin-dependent protein [Solirubrobacteraceae bacterium]